MGFSAHEETRDAKEIIWEQVWLEKPRIYQTFKNQTFTRDPSYVQGGRRKLSRGHMLDMEETKTSDAAEAQGKGGQKPGLVSLRFW